MLKPIYIEWNRLNLQQINGGVCSLSLSKHRGLDYSWDISIADELDLWGCFGFDEDDRWAWARVEELPGLVKRQKIITADNVVSADFGQPIAAAA